MKNRTAPIFVIIAATLWGIDGIILRPALYTLPVALVVFIESSIVAIMLSPFFFRRVIKLRKEFNSKDWLAFISVAFFGGALGTLAITKALFYVNFVSLSVVVLIQKLQPVFAIILASVILKEKPDKNFYFWSSVAIIGAYFMTFGMSLPDFETGEKTIEAVLFAMLAAVSFGSSTVLSKRALRNIGFETGTYIRFLFTSIMVLVLVFALNEMHSVSEITTSQMLIFFLIAFSTGGAAIFLYYYGLKNISASVATICELAFPLTAVVLDYFIHGTILSVVQWGGIIVLVFSIYKVSDMRNKV